MPVFKIVDYYEVEDVDVTFTCPVCEMIQSHRFKSHQDKVVTYCDRCERTIHIEMVVCPSCNSNKFVSRLHDLVRCVRCNIVIKDGKIC